MSSWRDQTSEEVQEDVDLLVGAALDVSENVLNDTGELRPFFIGVQTDGEKAMGSIGNDAEASELVERLIRSLKHNRDKYRAVAIVKDVALREQGTDAIWVDICHSDGISMTCYLPYRRVDGTLMTGDMGAQGCANHLWGD